MSEEVVDWIPFTPLGLEEAAKLERGDQIIYVPEKMLDAKGYFPRRHAQIKWGFVTNVTDANVFCRFWKPGRAGTALHNPLNSQWVSPLQIMKGTCARREKIQEWLGYLP